MGASQAREFSLFPAVTASQAMEFPLFPPLEALQAAEFQIARQQRLDSPPNPVFFGMCFHVFAMVSFKARYFTLFVAIKPVENIMFDNASNSLISPTVENTAIYPVFSSIFPCANAGSQLQHIYKRNPSKTLFLTVFFQCFQSNRR